MTPILYATPYLELFGDVAVGFMLLWQAVIADRRLNEIYSDCQSGYPGKERRSCSKPTEAPLFTEAKMASAQFFANTFLSLAKGKAGQ